ncbi:MAG: AAA family ATPase [Eubacteriales bacterium]|nr:AAA family ATPase [Eubacteriales bacterium]
MKNLIIVNGTMGVGKTATCRELQKLLPSNVFLDGDWCWDMKPFVVTDETKAMVLDNIAYLLNRFLRCSAYENILFCWVLQEQRILDDLLSRLVLKKVAHHLFTLTISEEALTRHIRRDIENGVRTEDVLNRSIARLSLYSQFTNDQIDVSEISAAEAAQQIVRRLRNAL